MKKKLISFIFLFIVLCFSCDNSSINRFVSKTTIKPFSELKDPVVLIQQISCQNKIFGMQVSSKIIGSVLMVVDFEEHKLFDWIYVPELYTFDFPYCCEVKIDESKTIYCASLSSSGKIVVLDPEKTAIEYIDTGMKNIGNICHKKAPKGVIYTSMEVKCDDPNLSLGIGINFTAFDINNPNKNITIPVFNSRKFLTSYKTFPNMGLIVPIYDNEKTLIKHVSVEDEEVNNESIFSCAGEKYDGGLNPYLLPSDVIDDKFFIRKRQKDYKSDKLFFLQKKSNTKYECSNEICIPENYSDFIFGQIFKIDNAYYSILFQPWTDNNKKIAKLDLNNCAIIEIYDFSSSASLNSDLFVRGNRIYYLDFSNNLVFSYYDFSNNTSNTVTVPKL